MEENKYVVVLLYENKISGTKYYDKENIFKQVRYTVELRWLEPLWDHEHLFETAVVRASKVTISATPEGTLEIIVGYIFGVLYFKCMLVHTAYIYKIKEENLPKLSVYRIWRKSLRTQERVRLIHGKRAIGVRATEVLLYLLIMLLETIVNPIVLVVSRTQLCSN